MPSTTPALAALAVGVHGALAVAALVALVIFAAWVAVRAYRDTEPSLDPGPRWLLTGLRWLVFLLVAAMLVEPVLHRRDTVVTGPSVLILVDDSASMQIRNADGTTRAESATRLRDELVDGLQSRPSAPRVFVGSGARRVEHERELGTGPLRDGAAESEGTDLAGLVLSGAQRHLEDNLQAIVLLSDGRSTARSAPSLAGFDVPVIAVAVGDSAGPVDVRLDRVRYPSAVHRGDRVVVDAELVVEAPEAGSVWTVLEDRDGAVMDSTLVSWPQGGGRLPLQFVIAADSLGVFQYRLGARAVGTETLLRNNAVQVGFEVGKDRLRVLYLESRPSWNAHFLARLAARDRRLEWIGVHRADDGLRLAGSDSLLTWPLTVEQQRDIDLWIAGSFDDLALMAAAGMDLTAHVREGAGLLVLAGDGTPVGRVPDALLPLLALRPDPRSRWIPGEVRAGATPIGLGHPILSIPSEFGSLPELLREVPPLRASLVPLDAAPDADVLLRGTGPRAVVPLLAVRDEGEGQVAGWAGAPLWSWSFWRLGSSSAEPLYRAVMGNLLATLAEGRGRERLRLFLPAPVVAQGADPELRAIALDLRLRPEEARDVWLEWAAAEGEADSTMGDDAVLGRARMQFDARTPGGRRLNLPALPPGAYRLRVSAEHEDGRLVSAWQPLTVDPYSVEFREPGTDRASLAALAARTGGVMLRADGVGEWARRVELNDRERVLTGRLDLWASPWLLIPLLLVLGLEWALRKRWGLI